MFRCHFCQQVTPPKTTKHKVVIATRDKHYPTRRRESKGPRNRFRFREEAVQDRGGDGVEIAQEVAACPACAAKHHEVQNLSASTPSPIDDVVVEEDYVDEDVPSN